MVCGGLRRVEINNQTARATWSPNREPSNSNESATKSARVISQYGISYLLALPATHEGWLSTLVVDVGPEVLDLGLRGSLGLLHGSIDNRLGFLVDLLKIIEKGAKSMCKIIHLELLLSCDTPLLNTLLETADRILSGSHALNLLTGTVGGSGVGHAIEI